MTLKPAARGGVADDRTRRARADHQDVNGVGGVNPRLLDAMAGIASFDLNDGVTGCLPSMRKGTTCGGCTRLGPFPVNFTRPATPHRVRR